MTTTQFVSQEVREQQGQFKRVSDRYMAYAGVERKGCCEFCGHPIRNHVGVQSPAGQLSWAGSDCASILCSQDAPVDLAGGTVYSQDGREYVAVDATTISELGRYLYRNWDAHQAGKAGRLEWSGRMSQFGMSILSQAQQYRRLTVRQHEAMQRMMSA